MKSIAVLLVVPTLACTAGSLERPHRAVAWDMSADALAVPADDPSSDADVPRQPASIAWAVDQRAEDIDRTPAPYVAESRGYWMTVGRDQLAAGVGLPTTAEGAVVKLHPLAGKQRAQAALSPDAVRLVDPAGSERDDAMALAVDWQELVDEGVPMPIGTTMFAIDPALGRGAFTLRSDAPGLSDAYLVHVQEPGSDAVLAVTTDRDAYLLGDTVVISAELSWGEVALSSGDLDARVRSPDGEGWALSLAPAGAAGRFSGSLVIDHPASPRGSLYDVEVCALADADGSVVRRCARTAFAYAVPTARLTGDVTTETGDGLSAAFALEVAAPGRYAIAGLLWGVDEHGVRQPAGVLQAADFLAAGEGTLTLVADAATVAASGLAGPWTIEDLRLLDQGRVGVLQRSVDGVAIDDAE